MLAISMLMRPDENMAVGPFWWSAMRGSDFRVATCTGATAIGVTFVPALWAKVT